MRILPRLFENNRAWAENVRLNCLSVMQFAVDVLKVRHVIVCGHYGCSGVRAALYRDRLGLIDNWLRHVQDVRQKHEVRLAGVSDETERCDRLCELNVIEQAANVCRTTIVSACQAAVSALPRRMGVPSGSK